jgi:hypothetical protein
MNGLQCGFKAASKIRRLTRINGLERISLEEIEEFSSRGSGRGSYAALRFRRSGPWPAIRF